MGRWLLKLAGCHKISSFFSEGFPYPKNVYFCYRTQYSKSIHFLGLPLSFILCIYVRSFGIKLEKFVSCVNSIYKSCFYWSFNLFNISDKNCHNKILGNSKIRFYLQTALSPETITLSAAIFPDWTKLTSTQFNVLKVSFLY